GQGLGCSFQPSDRRHVGLSNRPIENSRRSGSGQKTRRNFPLELQFGGDSDVGCRVGPLRLMSTEKIEIAFDCRACPCNQFEMFNAGITYLPTSPVLAVLQDSIMQI